MDEDTRVESLLPCPFCGCEVTVTERGNGLFAFLCSPRSSCIGSWMATYGHGDHREAVFRQWNTRDAAQAIEAASADKTRSGLAVGESAVAESDAPKTTPKDIPDRQEG